MKKILLDTNFLTLAYQFKLDIFEEIDRLIEEEHSLITTDGVIRELEILTKSRSKDGVAARIALKLLKTRPIKIMKTGKKNTDEGMISVADKDTIVATNDRKLRKILKDKNIKTIYLRGRKTIEIG